MSWSTFLEALLPEAFGLLLPGFIWLIRWFYKRNKYKSTPVSPPPLPTAQPLKPHGLFTPQEFHNIIEQSGRVPLEPPTAPTGLAGIWHFLKWVFFSSNSTPKSAFLISGWQYHPNFPSADCGPHRGFLLDLFSAPTENRRHLQRSLNPQKFGSDGRVLLVLASAQDLVNPNAWVRCLVVDSTTLNLPKDRRLRDRIAVQSSAFPPDNMSAAPKDWHRFWTTHH